MIKLRHILTLFSVLSVLIFFLPQTVMADADIRNITDDPVTPPLSPVIQTPTNAFNPATINKSDTFRCFDTDPSDGIKYTEQIVECFNRPIRLAVTDKTNGLLKKMSDFMSNIISALIVLAITFFGVKLLGGEQNLGPKAVALLLKIGIMLFLVNGFGGYAADLFKIFDEVTAMGVPNEVIIDGRPTPTSFNPWQMIDDFLGELLGFPTITTPNTNIKDGIIGLLQGSLFAKNLGAMITIVGGFAVFSLLLFIFEAVYLYISSVLTIGFLIIISPVVFPFMIFERTKGFLDRWIYMFMSNMFTPMLLFAFLWMFIGSASTIGTISPISTVVDNDNPAVVAKTSVSVKGVFDKPISTSRGIFKDTIDHIFRILNPNYAPSDPNAGKIVNYMDHCLNINQLPLPSELLATEPNIALFINNNSDTSGPLSLSAPTQTFVDPTQQKAFEYGIFNRRVAILNCDELNRDMNQDLFEALLEIFIFATLMNSLISKIPSISFDLAGGVSTGVANLANPLTQLIGAMRKK